VRRPSTTAHAVAAARAIGYRDLHDAFAVAFLGSGERTVVRRARSLAARPFGADAVAAATGGLTRHVALRMAAIDAAVMRAVHGGCQQVVILGAGFDTRAWRLPALAGRDGRPDGRRGGAVAVLEVDLPATQALKQAGLAAHRGVDPDRVTFVAADLGASALPRVLAPTPHDPARPTCWVWEAVVPYLPPDAVAATLDGVRAASAPGSALAMTFAHPALLGPRALAPATGALAGLAFRAVGEPIRSTYDEWDICALLGHHGFESPAVTDTHRWARDAGVAARPDPLRAELLVTAGTG
jgi:methyltransferase (TIGR00027 family)